MLPAIELTPGDSMNDVQCPVVNNPAQLLYINVYGFFYGVNPPRIWSSSFCLLFFPSIIVFSQRTLPSYDGQQVR